MVEYTLILNSDQAKEIGYAVEILMRMKINQPEEISRAVLEGIYDKIGFEEYLRRRNEADEHLKRAFAAMFPDLSEIRKDNEWYKLYNLYQVIRYAVHQAENPESKGVDSYPPIQFTDDEPLPECKWKKVKDNEKQNN